MRYAAFTFARWIGLVAVCLAPLTAGSAAELKPDASIKNKAVEASVLLDDQIKADAALAADCLAEGKRWIDKNAAEELIHKLNARLGHSEAAE